MATAYAGGRPPNSVVTIGRGMLVRNGKREKELIGRGIDGETQTRRPQKSHKG